MEKRLQWIGRLRTKLIENEDLLCTTIMYEMGKVWQGTAEDFTSIILPTALELPTIPITNFPILLLLLNFQSYNIFS